MELFQQLLGQVLVGLEVWSHGLLRQSLDAGFHGHQTAQEVLQRRVELLQGVAVIL